MLSSMVYGVHRGVQEAADLWSRRSTLLRCRAGESCSFLDVFHCNNQVRKQQWFEAVWAGLCTSGQHSPVTELGHVFPSRLCLLCIFLLGLDSAQQLHVSLNPLLTSCTVGLWQCFPDDFSAASGKSPLLPGTLHHSVPASWLHRSCPPSEGAGVHAEGCTGSPA